MDLHRLAQIATRQQSTTKHGHFRRRWDKNGLWIPQANHERRTTCIQQTTIVQKTKQKYLPRKEASWNGIQCFYFLSLNTQRDASTVVAFPKGHLVTTVKRTGAKTILLLFSKKFCFVHHTDGAPFAPVSPRVLSRLREPPTPLTRRPPADLWQRLDILSVEVTDLGIHWRHGGKLLSKTILRGHGEQRETRKCCVGNNEHELGVSPCFQQVIHRNQIQLR